MAASPILLGGTQRDFAAVHEPDEIDTDAQLSAPAQPVFTLGFSDRSQCDAAPWDYRDTADSDLVNDP
jgi:hypothetical protein